MPRHNAYIIYLISLHHIGTLISSHCHKKDEHSTIRYETETTLTNLILLLYFIVVNLLLCPVIN